MSNNGGFIPASIDHFAMKIIARFHLDKAATIGFVSTIIKEAVYEERKTVHLREAVSCFACRTVLLRYQGLNEQYCTRCPICRDAHAGGALPQEVLPARGTAEAAGGVSAFLMPHARCSLMLPHSQPEKRSLHRSSTAVISFLCVL